MNRGDKLKLVIPCDNSGSITPVCGKLDILYEDEDILCVNKPSAMPTHPSQNHHTDTLANLVCYYYKDIPFTFRVSNRLDSYTSGVVIIAKNMYSASFLCTNEFRQNMSKTYYAVCRGNFKNKKGTITAPVSRCSNSTIKREVSPNGKYAQTFYEVIKEDSGKSLVCLKPKTGRTHQIRVHMAHIGHPLINDFLYDEFYDGTSHFLLHCKEISFVHPYTKNILSINSELPIQYHI